MRNAINQLLHASHSSKVKHPEQDVAVLYSGHLRLTVMGIEALPRCPGELFA